MGVGYIKYHFNSFLRSLSYNYSSIKMWWLYSSNTCKSLKK